MQEFTLTKIPEDTEFYPEIIFLIDCPADTRHILEEGFLSILCFATGKHKNHI